MIGFKTKFADDVNTEIVNGKLDDDLETLIDSAVRRRKLRDGVPECPICNEPIEFDHNRGMAAHDHDGLRIAVLPKVRDV